MSDSDKTRQDPAPGGQARDRARQPWWSVPEAAAGGPPPLSFAQERFWFLDRLQGGNPVYHVPSMLPLHGPIDIAALRESLAALVSRHATLRTTFDMQGDRPVQVVAPMLNVP